MEIGSDLDHVHFLVQSVPDYSPTKIVRLIKSLAAREALARCSLVKKKLWGQFRPQGYFIASVGVYANADIISHYVREQGEQADYQKLHAQPLTRHPYPKSYATHSNTP